MNPKVSILLAVYNGADNLRRTIPELLAQTLADIEIVCVDDGSTDESSEVLREYAGKDLRVKPVFHGENKGTVAARKTGVMTASGEYIMFMDQDDSFDPAACEALYSEITEKDVDVLHFRSQVVAVPPTPESHRAFQELLLTPYDGYLFGEDVFWGCFDAPPDKVWNRYSWALWDKIFRADVCKLAMGECAEDYVVNGDDIYVYMLIAYYAASYFGDAKGPYYHTYRLGTGLMGNHMLSLSKFVTICRRTVGFDNGKRFLEDKDPGYTGKYTEVLDLDYSRCLRGIVQRWHERIAQDDKPAAFDMMAEYLPLPEVIATIHRDIADPVEEVLGSVKESKTTYIKKEGLPQRIGLYHAGNLSENIEAEQLAELLRDHDREVIIFTEIKNMIETASFDTVYLPDLKDGLHYKRPLRHRMQILDEALTNMDPDAFIFFAADDPHWAYDFLMVKCHGIPVTSVVGQADNAEDKPESVRMSICELAERFSDDSFYEEPGVSEKVITCKT